MNDGLCPEILNSYVMIYQVGKVATATGCVAHGQTGQMKQNIESYYNLMTTSVLTVASSIDYCNNNLETLHAGISALLYAYNLKYYRM